MMKRILLIAMITTLSSIALFSQTDEKASWTNINRVHNFYDIQADFNKYWDGKNITPETPRQDRPGWKQFKRWEWFWEQRVEPSGVFPKRGHVFEEYLKYRQSKDLNKFNSKQSSTWSHLGPITAPGGYEGIGRLNCIAEDPNYNGTTNSTIWVGAASGGVWKSTNAGSSWTTNTDELASLGVADIVIDPNNSNIMFLATGDGDASDAYSIGVLKSTNAGQTWGITGFQQAISSTQICRRMIMSHSSSSVLFVATNGGLMRTTNGGTTWTQMVSGSFFDVKMHPTNADIVYACTGSTFYKTTNGGTNWTSNSTGLPTNSTRYAMAISPAAADYVYLLSTNSTNGYNGLFRSTDAGVSFSTRSTTPNVLNSSSDGSGTGGQGWYDLALAVEKTNANNVYVGGVNIWKSTDGGANWGLKTFWYNITGTAAVHADHHMLYAGNGNRIYACHDGGLDITTNGGTNWTYKGSGLAITQFYRISSSQTNQYEVLCGAQDNSTFLRNSSSFGMTKGTGDGMDQAINPVNGNYMFTASYYGNLSRSTNAGSSWSDVTKPSDDGAWVTPYEIDPNNPSTLIIGYKNVWKSTNNGANWTQISTFTNSSTLTSIHINAGNSNYIYAARSGAMWRTTNGGTNWSSISLPASSITSITTNNLNPDEVWISISGFTSGSKVFYSTNGGTNWTNISGSLPNVPCNKVMFEPASDNRVWVGTDIGVWYRGTNNANWVDYNDGLPNVVCNDLDIYTAGSKLRVGTYGRGLWEVDLPDAPNSPPTLLSPANNALNIPQTVNFTWNATSSALTYRIQVSSNSTFASLVSNTIENVPNKTVAGLAFNTQYYWRVRAMSATDTSDWSQVRNFTTRPPLLIPNLLNPLMATNVSSDTITFTWSKDLLASGYRLQVANDSLFANVYTNIVITDTTYTGNPYPIRNKYWWRVQTVNGANTSSWSQVSNFTNDPIILLEIGTGTVSTSFPFYTVFHDASSFFLYKNSDILAAGGRNGTLKSIAFNILTVNTSLQAMNDFKIFVQHSQLASIAAPITAGWTLVYSTSSFTPTSVGWNEFVFQDPFVYDGASNLLVKVCFNNTAYTANSTVYGTSVTGTTHCRYQDNGATDGCDITPSSSNTPARPNIRLLLSLEFAAPSLISPNEGEGNFHVPTPFSWTNSPGATKYQLQISSSSAFTSLVENSFVTTNSKTVNGLPYLSTFYWRVRAINTSDTSAWTGTRYFSTRPVLFVPILFNPSQAVNINANLLNFLWGSQEGATNYRIQISEDSLFNTFHTNQLITDTNFTLSNLVLDKKYFWRVRAINASGMSDWTYLRYFTTYSFNNIEIGNGSVTSTYPFHTYYHDGLSFFLYPSSEIIAAGGSAANISSLWFNISSVNQGFQALNDFKIFLQNTTLSSVIATVDTGWTMVYSVSSYTPYATGWNEFVFQTPFQYISSKNLLVKVCFNNETYSANSQVYATNVTGTTHCRYEDNGTDDGCITPLAYVENVYRPNIRLTMTTPLVLGVPELQSPADYSTNQIVSPTLIWNAASNATSYRLQVSASSSFANFIYNDTTTNTQTILPSLAYDAIYYWRVCSKRNNDSSAWSSSRQFTTELPPLLAPNLIAPIDNASNTDLNANLKWNLSANALSYDYQVSKTNTFIVVLFGNSIADSTVSLSNLETNTNYFWRVRANRDSVQSSWSDVRKFTTGTGSPLQNIALTNGLNMISANLTPQSLAMSQILSPLSGKYSNIKNMFGQTYAPPFQTSLSSWNIYHAYQIRMNQAATMTLVGPQILPETTPIVLNQLGLYWLPYFRTSSMAPGIALASITGKYLQVKNIQGQVYQPPFSLALTQLVPNSGYIIRMSSSTGTLTYPANTVIKQTTEEQVVITNPSVLVRPSHITGKTSFIAMDLQNVEDGDEIGVFTRDGMLVGSSLWQYGMHGVVVWGDDETTNEKDGASEGEALIVKIWSKATKNIGAINQIALSDMTNNAKSFELTYQTDGVHLLKGIAELPSETRLLVSPQPASDELILQLNQIDDKEIDIKLFDQQGKIALEITKASNQSIIKLDLKHLASGVYHLLVNASTQTYSEKVVIVR